MYRTRNAMGRFSRYTPSTLPATNAIPITALVNIVGNISNDIFSSVSFDQIITATNAATAIKIARITARFVTRIIMLAHARLSPHTFTDEPTSLTGA